LPRHIRITLEERDVSCVARLLEDEAPRTCEHVWNALPQANAALHAKYASNEVYCLVPSFGGTEPGLEYSTVMQIPGDVMYFDFEAGILPDATRASLGLEGPRFVDLAIFYGRNNLLLNPATGFVPGNVFATIEEGYAEMAAACEDLFRTGHAGERLRYERHDTAG
jgi:hypothetical protein